MDFFHQEHQAVEHRRAADGRRRLVGAPRPIQELLASLNGAPSEVVFEEWIRKFNGEWVNGPLPSSFEPSPVRLQHIDAAGVWQDVLAVHPRELNPIRSTERKGQGEQEAFRQFRAVGNFTVATTGAPVQLVVYSGSYGLYLVDPSTNAVFHLVQCQAMNNIGNQCPNDDNTFWAKDIGFLTEALQYSMNPSGYNRVAVWLFHKDDRGCVVCLSFMKRIAPPPVPEQEEEFHVQTFCVSGRPLGLI